MKYSLRYDFANKRFYTGLSKLLNNIKQFSLTAIIPMSKDTMTFGIDLTKKIKNYDVPLLSKYDYRQVKFLKKDEVLFLNMPDMSYPDFYINEIKKLQTKMQKQSVKKIIIDIRDNTGGG